MAGRAGFAVDGGRAELLLHPVRIRIALASAGRPVTTQQLARELTDVPPATLYRHVRALADGGMLAVVEQRQIRGAVEKTYTLATELAHLGSADLEGIDPEQHLTYLSAFLGAVLEGAAAYLRAPISDPGKDGYGYHQIPLWLTDEELSELAGTLQGVLRDAAAHEPAPGRRRRLLTTILVPDADAPDADRPGANRPESPDPS